jgi:hypothetical protein
MWMDNIPPPFRNSKTIPLPLSKLKTILELLEIPLLKKEIINVSFFYIFNFMPFDFLCLKNM